MFTRLAPAATLAAEIANTALCHYGVTPAVGIVGTDVTYVREILALRLAAIRTATQED